MQLISSGTLSNFSTSLCFTLLTWITGMMRWIVFIITLFWIFWFNVWKAIRIVIGKICICNIFYCYNCDDSWVRLWKPPALTLYTLSPAFKIYFEGESGLGQLFSRDGPFKTNCKCLVFFRGRFFFKQTKNWIIDAVVEGSTI